MKVKSLSHAGLLVTPWTAAHQAPPSMDSPGKSAGVGARMLINCWWECKTVEPTPWETFSHFLTKLNTALACDPAVTLLGVYQDELKTYVHAETSTSVYRSFIHNCKNSKQTKCHLVGERISKLVNNEILFRKEITIKP